MSFLPSPSQARCEAEAKKKKTGKKNTIEQLIAKSLSDSVIDSKI
jgi:hypothetical protein